MATTIEKYELAYDQDFMRRVTVMIYELAHDILQNEPFDVLRPVRSSKRTLLASRVLENGENVRSRFCLVLAATTNLTRTSPDEMVRSYLEARWDAIAGVLPNEQIPVDPAPVTARPE